MSRITQLLCILLASACSLAQTPSTTVDQPAARVTVRSLVFDDTADLPNTVARSAEEAVTSRTYGADYQSEIAEVVRDALQRRGYFKAAVQAPVRVTVVRRENGKSLIDVHVIATLGERYYLDSISFRGTTAFSPAKLRRQFPIKDGEVFDIEKIRGGMKAVKDLYCTKGYVNFTPVPDFTFDEREHRVAMLLDVDEGAPYRVGTLTVAGDTTLPAARNRLQQAWKKYEGTYSCDPVRRLLSDLHACRDGAKEPLVEIEQDDIHHVIDYTITLVKPKLQPASCTPR